MGLQGYLGTPHTSFLVFPLSSCYLANPLLPQTVLEMLVSNKVKSEVACRVRLFATPWTVTYQAPLSTEFSRQEYWSGLPFPPPGDLPDPGIKPTSLVSPALVGRYFTS